MALQDPVNEEMTFAFYQTLGNSPPLIGFFFFGQGFFWDPVISLGTIFS